VLKKLPLTKKFFINNAFYLVPLTILLYLVFNTFSKDIDFAAKEIIGSTVEKTTLGVLHGGMIGEDKSAPTQEHVKALMALRTQHEGALNLDEKTLEKKNKKQLISKTLEASVNAAKIDLAVVNDLVTYVGDSSNLILDPDLDSYYMMDATILAVPQLMNRLKETQDFLDGRKTAEALTLDEKINLSTYIKLLGTIDGKRISDDIQTATAEDVNFYGSNDLLQKNLGANLTLVQKDLADYISLLKNFSEGKVVDALELSKKYKKVQVSVLTFENQALDILNEMLTARISAIKSTRASYMAIGILAIIIALGFSFFITRIIKTDLYDLVSRLEVNSKTVDDSSKNSMDISLELSASVREQAASVQEISATTEEISQMAGKNNEFVRSSIDASQQTLASVNNAKDLMNDLKKIIEEIKSINGQLINRSELNSKSFASIVTIMSTIEDKTKVIHDIVFQTKLLSFNASVEAARAGEQGKGFAVVAEEVGKLAEMSGQAAKDIAEVLTGSMSKVKTLTEEADREFKKVIQTSTSSVEVAILNVTKSQESNDQVVHNSERINQMFGEIVQASDEQTKGVVEITKAISHFDLITDKNAQLADSISDSSKILAEKSEELRQVIQSLSTLAGLR
jgi:methyl-accepting chemotaxis protein